MSFNSEGVDYRPEGFVNEGRPNCGVVSTAVVLGKDYDEVETVFRRINGYQGNWKGRSRVSDWMRVAQHYGKFLWKVEGLPRKMIETVLPMLSSDKRYLVRVGGHVMAYINGKLVDQSGTWDITHPRRRRKIVKEVYEVVGGNVTPTAPTIPEAPKKTKRPYKYALYINGHLEKKYKRMPSEKTIQDWLRYGCRIKIATL